jgi:septum formation protein
MDFSTLVPGISETAHAEEQPGALALRLASSKAAAIAREHPEAVVIGSDQLAALDNEILGKPGKHSVAAHQLERCSGKTVVFHTAVCVSCISNSFEETHVDITTVHFRTLTPAEIDSYLAKDQPWDCAGSFRSEGLGATLFDAIENQDPAAIIGLPLIWLAASLQRAGINLLTQEPV